MHCNHTSSTLSILREFQALAVLVVFASCATGCENLATKNKSEHEWEIVNFQDVNTGLPLGKTDLVIMYNKQTGSSYYLSSFGGLRWVSIVHPLSLQIPSAK